MDVPVLAGPDPGGLCVQPLGVWPHGPLSVVAADPGAVRAAGGGATAAHGVRRIFARYPLADADPRAGHRGLRGADLAAAADADAPWPGVAVGDARRQRGVHRHLLRIGPGAVAG